ncbi:homeodomain-like protein [Tanacetum coccineum]
MYKTRQTTIPFPSHLNNSYCEEKKGSYGPQFSEAYSYGTSHIDKSIPQKEKDPGSFTLPCYINNVSFDNALANLGASVSVMPLSAYLNLGLGELAHTKLRVELADRTVKYPKGIAENVLVGIGKFVFPIDFVILDMPEDIKVPLILGRPFLSTAHAKIDVFKRKIILRVGEEKIIFKSVKPASSLIKRVYMLSLREGMELDLEARRDQVDDLMPTIEEGKVIEEFRARNDVRMKDKLEYKGNNVVGALMNIPIFVGTFSILIDFAVLEDMDTYRDKGMGDVIFGEPFLREVGINATRFEGMITIYNDNKEVTYQMVQSHLRFRHHTNEQCNKILPLLKVSQYGVFQFMDMAYWFPDLAAKKSTKLVKYQSFGILSIEQFLNRFTDQPNETSINDLEFDDGSVDTPLVSPFPHSDNDSNDEGVLNELSEYENTGTLCRERIINSFDGDDLAFECMIGFRKFTAYLNPFLPINIISRKAYNTIMVDKLEGTGKNLVAIVRDVYIFVGSFTHITDFVVLEDIREFIMSDMAEVLMGRPFRKITKLKYDVAKGLVSFTKIFNTYTYRMPRIIPRLKDFNKSKVPPLLELSQNDLMNGFRHPYEKNKLMYKNCLNLGPEYQVNESMKEWLIRGHVNIQKTM